MKILRYDRDDLNAFMDKVSNEYEKFTMDLLTYEAWKNLMLDNADSEAGSFDRQEWSKSFQPSWVETKRNQIRKALQQRSEKEKEFTGTGFEVTDELVKKYLNAEIKKVRTIRIAPSASKMLKMIKDTGMELKKILDACNSESEKKTKQLQFFRELLQPVHTFEVQAPFTLGRIGANEGDLTEELRAHQDKEREIWFGSTAKELNIRLGLKDADTNNPKPMKFDDNVVHGAGGGRTGSGKSVTINTILANLLLEYAPWELNLYLADFKIVELMRYATPVPTPHVAVVAATSAADYVVSFFEAIEAEMQALQQVFAATGFQKLSEFREAFNLVIPRNLILVDEFQQLFRDVKDPKAQEAINGRLGAVAALGRATGYHMFLTSQNVGKALAGDLKDNMNMGLALPAPETISNDLIGNPAAAFLKGKGKGIINVGKVDPTANQHFQIPFLQSELSSKEEEANTQYLEIMSKKYPNPTPEQSKEIENGMPFTPYLNKLLVTMNEIASDCGFKKELKYYNEGDRTDYEVFEGMFEQLRQDVLKRKSAEEYLELVLCLGDTTVYKQDTTLEMLEVERGDRNNFAIASTDDKDLVNIFKVMHDSLDKINLADGMKNSHIAFVGDQVFYSRYIQANYKFDFETMGEFRQDILTATVEKRKDFVKLSNTFKSLSYGTLFEVAKFKSKTLDYAGWGDVFEYLDKYAQNPITNVANLGGDLDEYLTMCGDIMGQELKAKPEDVYETVNAMYKVFKEYLTACQGTYLYDTGKQPKVFFWVFMPDKFKELDDYSIKEDLKATMSEGTSYGVYTVFICKSNENLTDYKTVFGYFLDRTTDNRITMLFNAEPINQQQVLEGFFRIHWVRDEKFNVVKGFRPKE